MTGGGDKGDKKSNPINDWKNPDIKNHDYENQEKKHKVYKRRF